MMANENARQKRLEKKRRKREEKRRALRAPDSVGWAPPPMPKLSATLTEFAKPLLDRLPDDVDAWKFVLSWAAMVWNAADDEVSKLTIALGHEMFAALGWQDDAAEEARRLRARKKEMFPWDRRKVAGVEVEDRGDMMYVVALGVLR